MTVLGLVPARDPCVDDRRERQGFQLATSPRTPLGGDTERIFTMARIYLENLERGMTVDEVFLVESVNFKQARNGSCFLQLVLRDFTGSIRAMRWESNQDEFRAIEQNPFLQISGRVEEYQGNLQIIIDRLTPLSEGDAKVNPEEFLPRTRYAIDAMAAELRTIIDSIPNDAVRRIVDRVLERPGAWDALCAAPAGKSMHHAYIGGLLEHVLSLAKLALGVLDQYPWLDRSVLIAGVVLHDLAKIEELSHRTGFQYTDTGQLLGHLVLVTNWIDEAARELGDIDPEIVLELKHIALSHHGKLEFGSPKVPATAEALALHYIDNLDAKLAGYWNAYNDTKPRGGGDRFSEYNVMLGTRLYFPNRMDGAKRDPLASATPGRPLGGTCQGPRPAADDEPHSDLTPGELPFG